MENFEHLKIVMASVKPFKSKNRDKIDLDAPNPNLKKGCDRDFRATAKLICVFVGWKVQESSSAKFYSSCMELSIQ